MLVGHGHAEQWRTVTTLQQKRRSVATALCVLAVLVLAGCGLPSLRDEIAGRYLSIRRVRPFARASLELVSFLPSGALLTVQQAIENSAFVVAAVVNPRTGAEVRRFALRLPPPASTDQWLYPGQIALSPDGTLLAGALSWTRLVYVWDLQGLEKHRFELPRAPHAVAFSPDGSLLAAADRDGDVRVWDARTGEVRMDLRGSSLPTPNLTWTPDGQRLVLNRFGSLRVWDLARGTSRENKGAGEVVSSSRDGKRLASAADEKAWVHENANGGVQELKDARRLIAMSPDGARMAAQLGAGSLGIWDASTGARQFTLPASCLPVQSVSFSPDSRIVVAAYPLGELRFHDAVAGRELLALNVYDCRDLGYAWRPQQLAFSPDGTTLAVGDSGGEIEIYTLTGPLAPLAPLPERQTGVPPRLATPETVLLASPLPVPEFPAERR